MGSNPPIKAIPPSVAEPNKHIAAFLHSTQPYASEFAARGKDYFGRSRAGGDVLSEEDWRRDFYANPSSRSTMNPKAHLPPVASHKRRSSSHASAHTHTQSHSHAHPHPHSYPHPHPLSQCVSVSKPGSPPRYSSSRPTPYMRRSVDMKTGDLTADGFGIRAGRENRRSVQSGTAVKLDALQAAIAIKQCPTRLSFPRTGILAHGVMSQAVKVAPSSIYPVDLHPAPPSAYAEPASVVPVWASPYDAPATHWIDEIGSLYGLGGGAGAAAAGAGGPGGATGATGAAGAVGNGDERPHSWYITNAGVPINPNKSTAERRYRPVSAPLPDAAFMVPESVPSHVATAAPAPALTHDMPWALQCDSLETFELIEPIKPIDTFEPFDPQSQWQSDPMTPATGSDEIITFGWAPEHPHKQWSPAAPYPGTGAGCVGVGIGVTSVLGHDERPPSIPSMNVLSIQSPLPFSPYFATSDYHQVY